MSSHLNVFINCPFDTQYRPSFEALIFTISACGYRARCALEEDDSGDIRFDKLCRLIEQCDRSVHDLSRIELGKDDLPRFNMPFELGLAFGAKRFGGKRQRVKTALIMVAEPYRLPAYLSDLGGNDIAAHHRDPVRLIGLVRRYLHVTPQGAVLPGAARLNQLFERYKAELPKIAAAADIGEDEIDPYGDYRTYVWFVTEFIKTLQSDG